MNRAFWSGKRVFLTGHTGFKGSWLALWLERLGSRVTGYALEPPSRPSLFERAEVAGGLESIHGDLRDLDRLRQAMTTARPQVVLHLAAQSLVKEGYRDPLGTYSTNVQGTAHVLEAARGCDGLEALVSVTTDKCYRNDERAVGFREEDPLGGHDPYSSSKAGAELVTAAYRRSFFRDGAPFVASARAGNVIGGGDWAADRLIPDLIRGFSAGETVKVRSPAAIRPWQHVLEPLRGYLEVAEHLATGGAAFAEAWNFGPEESDARPVEWIATRAAELWGDGAGWELDDEVHPPEATYLKLDVSKAGERLGWRPVVDLETALGWIVDWHRREAAGESARELCAERIARYEERLEIK